MDPSINQRFLEATEQDMPELNARFESDEREIAAVRHALFTALQVEEGMHVADVGAGTGLFAPLFNHAVGPTGKVYCGDFSPQMVAYLRKRARMEQLKRVEVISCTNTTTGLAPASVDLLFICDTYHHFEQPEAMLQSIFQAVRPGGHFALVDYERVQGVTDAWMYNHLRVGKQEAQIEVEAAGFEFLGESEVAGLIENYMLMFQRR
jgi:ubiquinone/menaquinone biosynthesis C-methylase UbiE